MDTYVLATPRTIFTPVVIGLSDHTLTHKKVDSEKMASIFNQGLHVYRVCDSLAYLFPDLIMTVGLFFGGLGTNPNIPFFGSKPTFWQEYLNPLFIKNANGYEW